MGIPDVEAACEVEPRNRTHGRSHHSYAGQAKRDFEMYKRKRLDTNAHKIRQNKSKM